MCYIISVAIETVVNPTATLKMGNFHRTFLSDFTGIVSSYITSLEEQLKSDLAQSFSLETWLPVR